MHTRSREQLRGLLSDLSVSQAQAFAADQASAGSEEQTVAIEKGCARGDEGCGKRCAGDSAACVELIDPCLGEIGVVGLGFGT